MLQYPELYSWLKNGIRFALQSHRSLNKLVCASHGKGQHHTSLTDALRAPQHAEVTSAGCTLHFTLWSFKNTSAWAPDQQSQTNKSRIPNLTFKKPF